MKYKLNLYSAMRSVEEFCTGASGWQSCFTNKCKVI